MNKEIIGRRIFIVASVFFIALGIGCNYYVISWLLYGADILPTSQKIFITAVDAVIVLFGYLCWRVRNDTDKQINIAVLLVTIGICFLVTEGVLRMVSPGGVTHPSISLFTQGCPVLGLYCNKPNLSISTRVGFGEITIKTNAFGMAGGKEVSLENPTGNKRIALLGDSNTFGFWASSFENSFAGKITEAQKSQGVEVLDFGVSGYGQTQEKKLLKEYVLQFKPSSVVLFFTNSNDFRDNYLGLNMYSITPEGTAVINEAVYSEKMGIARRGHASPAIIKNLLGLARNSQVYSYAYNFVKNSLGISQKPLDLGNFMSPMYWTKSEYTQIADSAKLQTLQELRGIALFCKEHDVAFSIVAIPFYEQVYYQNPVGQGYDMAYPEAYIQAFAASEAIAYFDLLPPLREYVAKNPGEKLYNEDGLHFNDAGHQVAADLLMNFVTIK